MWAVKPAGVTPTGALAHTSLGTFPGIQPGEEHALGLEPGPAGHGGGWRWEGSLRTLDCSWFVKVVCVSQGAVTGQ